MNDLYLKTIQYSALWAAYGDALGFITELADQNAVKARANVDRVKTTIPWKRRIGGRFGPTIELPAGCYSDDTQLRLSAGRAILDSGHFDVEAFAKVELPVWPSYALGGGKSSKIAASQLSRKDVNWFSNFFEQREIKYINGGGNGAAMRIQPHVWSSYDISKPESYITDVVRNAICTHGHPRGILGAVFHAICLASACRLKVIPGPDVWQYAVDYFSKVPELIKKDSDLSAFWMTTWEEKTGQKIAKAFEEVKWESTHDINNVMTLELKADSQTYRRIVEKVGGLSAESRGSGIKTSIIASILSWLFRDSDPNAALEVAANLLFSDTDTIATMSGAILGCSCDNEPPGEVLDREYILSEATRLFNISQKNHGINFMYPDISNWNPPRNQVECVGKVNGDMAVSGLAIMKPIGKEYYGQEKDNFLWQWAELSYGQTILIKRRKVIAKLSPSNYPKVQPINILPKKMFNNERVGINNQKDESLVLSGPPGLASNGNIMDIEELTHEAIKSGFDALIIGKHMIELGKRKNAIELSIAYASIVSKALSTREKSNNKKQMN